MGGEKIVEMGAGLSIGLQSLNRKARNLRRGQEIEPKTSKRELLWAKAKKEDTAAWRDPVRGHHLERISSFIQRFFSYTRPSSFRSRTPRRRYCIAHRRNLKISWYVRYLRHLFSTILYTCSDRSRFSFDSASHLLRLAFRYDYLG